MEPGRFIAGNAGILVTEVQYVKAGGDRRFLLCDSGWHHLIRPALYGAYHHIWPVEPGEKFSPRLRTRDEVFQGTELVDVVGPTCESTDFFAKDRHLPPVARGDLLAVFSAGAYGMAMASEYNSFPRPAEVLVDGAGPPHPPPRHVRGPGGAGKRSGRKVGRARPGLLCLPLAARLAGRSLGRRQDDPEIAGPVAGQVDLDRRPALALAGRDAVLAEERPDGDPAVVAGPAGGIGLPEMVDEAVEDLVGGLGREVGPHQARRARPPAAKRSERSHQVMLATFGWAKAAV